ncbi:MAG: SRPBCC family protein [Jatrophihabitantaceae bacterium]
MQLEHTFTVPAGVEQAWQVLLDIERVAPCMPGASLETIDGDQFTGTVKVRLGPIGLTYKGKASFVEKDEAAHRVVIDAQGRDSRGNGTASAKVTATLAEAGAQTEVVVRTDLTITGKPAQFGRGVLADVGNKLIGQFADCLAGKLAGTDAAPLPEAEAAPAGPTVGEQPTGAEPAAAKPAVAEPAAPEQPAVVGSGVTPTAAPAAMAAGPGPTSVETASGGDTGNGADAERPAAEVAAGIRATADSSAPGTEPVAPTFTEPAGSSGSQPGYPAGAVEPIDLLRSAGPAMAKRLAPVVVAVLAIVLFVILRRRR